MTTCLAPDACAKHPKSSHCKSCVSIARWSDPERRAAMGASISAAFARNGRKPFRDELKARRAVLYASAFGLRRAGKMLGISPTMIAKWRTKLEKITGQTYERRPGFRQTAKLTMDQAREIRALRKAGEKLEYIGALYGINHTTVSKICLGQRYPEAAAAEDLDAWNRLGRGPGRAA